MWYKEAQSRMNVLQRDTIKDECATKRRNLEVCLLLGEGINQLEVVLFSVLRYFSGDSTL